MMTVDQLRQEIASLEQQRQRAYDTYQQAQGALALLRALLQSAEQANAMPLQRFAEAVGGVGATASVNGTGEM